MNEKRSQFSTKFNPASFVSVEFTEICAQETGLDQTEVRRRFEIYLSEIRTGYALLENVPLHGKSILEVGAGLGLLSAQLKSKGYDITAIEPGAGGFDFNAKAGRLVRQHLVDEQFPVLDISADSLDPDMHGGFDVIFSVNVLEHIPNLESALSGMLQVLKPDGMMIHTCPNYLIPYEPHFGIPLIPFAPKKTEWLQPNLKGNELWQSLNFVTARRLRRYCAVNQLNIKLHRGTLYEAFSRLESDAAFRSRQPVPLRWLLEGIQKLGGARMLRHVPPLLSTPMSFTIQRNHERGKSPYLTRSV